MNKYSAFGDLSDAISFVCISQITVDQVLNWVYMAVFIASLLLGIILKIVGYFSDKKITKDEIKDLQKTLDDTKKQLEDEINKNKAVK